MGRKPRLKDDTTRGAIVDDLEAGAPEPVAGAPEPGTGAEPESSQAATISVVEGEVDPEKRARKLESQKRYRDRARAKRLGVDENPDLSRQQAALLVTIVSATAGSLVGPGATMLEHERELILDPLARIIARMPSEARANMDRYVDPLALLFGLSVWGVRVYQASQTKPASEAPEQVGAPYPIPTPEPAPEPVTREPERGQVVTQSPALARDLARLVGGVA